MPTWQVSKGLRGWGRRQREQPAGRLEARRNTACQGQPRPAVAAGPGRWREATSEITETRSQRASGALGLHPFGTPKWSRTGDEGFEKLQSCLWLELGSAGRMEPKPAGPPPEPAPWARGVFFLPAGGLPRLPEPVGGGDGQEGTGPREGDSQLMVMPSSTPRLLGSFTWKVPLLGMTDSGYKQRWTQVRFSPTSTPIYSSGEGPTPSCSFHRRDAKTEARELMDWFKTTNPPGPSGSRDWNPDLMPAGRGFPLAKPSPVWIQR